MAAAAAGRGQDGHVQTAATAAEHNEDTAGASQVPYRTTTAAEELCAT